MRAIKIKMRNIVIVFFSLFLTLAVFSQTNAANPKPKPGFGGGDWLYFKSNNDLTAYLGKKSSSLPTVRYQKDNDYLEFSMTKALKTDISSTTDVSLETNVKTPNTPTLFYRNILDGADVNYQITNIPFKIKEEIILKETFPTSHVGKVEFLFSAETSAKPVKQKDGSIAFFGENGEYLFQLDKPFMVDGKGTRSEEVGLDIVSTQSEKLKTQKHNEKGKKFNFKFQNSNFESIFNDLILKHLNIPPFIQNSKLNHLFKIQNSKLEIEPQSYQIILKVDTIWLNDPNTAYPVIIDPTVTHSTDAQFNGQKNRVSDSNSSTDAVQLESSYPEAIKDPHTVLLMHFNEANGTTAGIRDYASTTRVITANGNASTTSYVTQLGLGNSAAFDGTGDYVSIPGNNDFYFTNTGSLSIDFWVKLNATNRHHGLIGGTTWSGSADTDWMIDWLDSNQLRFQKYSSGPTASIPQDTNWHHIAVIGIGGSFTLYFDGISVATSNISSSWGSQSTNLLIGTGGAHFNNVDSLYLNGYLDSLRIIKGRALTPEEIKAAASRRPYAVYTSPVVDASASVQWDTVNWTEGGVNTGNGEQPYNTNSLVAQWDFNDTSGATLTASSSGSCTTACNGTLTNFAYTASQDQATTTTGWTANNKKWGAGALMMESAASADYVSITDPASNVLDPNSADLTIETWIKTSDTSAEIFSNNNANGTACTSNGYYLGIDANGYPVFYLDTNGATAGCDASVTSQFKINDGNWHNVSVSATRGTSAIIYVDGKSAGSDTSVTSYSAITVTGNAFFGGSAGGLDAILDSARYYSRALSAAEVLSNYQAGNIEIQTRTGATSDPNDGSWEAWKPTTGETQLLSMDSDAANWSTGFSATGGTITYSGGYTIHTFTSSGTFAVTGNGNVEVLVVAGGGGGADSVYGGGGGGGGLISNTAYSASGNITVTVGAGGAARTNGSNSVFGTLTAIGGGKGNSEPGPGGNGGDGGSGGGAGCCDTAGGSGTAGQGFAGGTGAGWGALDPAGAGGGGAGAVGANAALNAAGNGGVGLASSISGSSVYYGGGGGGAVRSGTNGAGGNGGGGAGGTSGAPNTGIAGTANTGGGGGGGTVPGTGGSGIVIVRYSTTNKLIGITNESNIKMEGTGSLKIRTGMASTTANTVALWHFEETGTTTGTYLYDETANNNDATTTGTTVVDGIFGKARKFNGTSDYVSAADSDNWNFGTGNFTIDFWVKWNNLAGVQMLWSQWQNGNNAYYLYKSASHGIAFVCNLGGIAKGSYATSEPISGLSINTWYHIVFERTTTTAKLFVNGESKTLTETTAFGTNDAGNNTGTFYFGQEGDGLYYFNGSLDEPRILKGRALSADEIAETYRMGANHRISRTITSADLSAKTKLPFYVAADRPGTYLEATIGESANANYYLDNSAIATNTVLYIKGDEIASSTSIKDSSFSGKAITANGDARTASNGKIGNSVYFDGTGDYLSVPASSDWGFGAGDFAIDMWVYPTSNPNAITGVMGLGASGSDSLIYTKHSASSGNMQASMKDTGGVTYIKTTTPISLNVWQHIALVRNGNNLNFYLNSNLIGSADITGKTMVANSSALAIGIDEVLGAWAFFGYIDEVRVIKGSTLTPDQIRQAYEYGLRTHPTTIDFGATLQTSDLISSATDYNFSLTATTSGLSATTSGLYLGDKIIIKENLGGTEYTAQGTVNAINTTTGAITVPSWDTGSTFPSGNGYSPNATVFKWQREYFDITGAATTTRNAITNLTLRPTNGAEGRTIYLDDFRYNTNYLTASSSSAITSGNNRYLQYRAIFTSTDTYVSPFLSAFNTLYTAVANSFPAIIGISGGGFLSF